MATPKLANFHRYSPKKGGWTLPKGTALRFKSGQGYFTVPKPKGTVVRPGTQQARTTIETPAQIEARVKRMAQEQFDREKSLFDTEAEQMRRDAEGRRLDLIDAYAAAGKANAAMGSQVQAGWNLAGQTIQGLGQAGTGTVSDALRADLATQDQALARLGAAPGSTGFDPTSQAGVEAYRGGYLPAELMTRMGGVANEALLRQAQNLKERGLEEATVGENEALADIRTKTFDALKGFSENRMKNEADYREQLLGARQGQIDAINDAKKILAGIRSDQAKLRSQYIIAKLNATTKKELQQVEAIWRAEDQRLKGLANQALINQRNASAGLYDVKAEDIRTHPGTGGSGGNKPPTATQVSSNVSAAREDSSAAIKLVKDNIWKVTPFHNPSAEWIEEHGPFKDNEALEAAYQRDPLYKAAIKWRDQQRTKSFKTAYTKVIQAMAPHLRAIRYSPDQIKRMAFQALVSNGFNPPKGIKTYKDIKPNPPPGR